MTSRPWKVNSHTKVGSLESRLVKYSLGRANKMIYVTWPIADPRCHASLESRLLTQDSWAKMGGLYIKEENRESVSDSKGQNGRSIAWNCIVPMAKIKIHSIFIEIIAKYSSKTISKIMSSPRQAHAKSQTYLFEATPSPYPRTKVSWPNSQSISNVKLWSKAVQKWFLFRWKETVRPAISAHQNSFR